jgi:ABC-type polysaccharide/polyol phosphate transport system ATPase subunit
MGTIALEGVWKKYRVYGERYRSLKEVAIKRRLGRWEDRWVLRDVDLAVDPGSSFGLVGPNGAGKSTTLKLMARILSPDRGQVRLHGRVSGLIELGAGFQPEYTGRENIFLNGSLLGLTGREIRRRLDRIVAFSELEASIDEPMRTYSSGMQMRLGFAIAANVDPEVLLVDEVLAVGDEAFQRKCIDWLDDFKRQGGTLVLVSHNLGAIRQMCEQAAWIQEGTVRALGSPDEVVSAYLDDVREHRDEQGSTAVSATETPAVQLTTVRLLDGQGREVEQVKTGDSLSVEIGYRCHRHLETPVFGVALYRNDGTYIYGSNTAVDGVQVPAIDRDGKVTLTYPSLPLLSGTYLLTVAIFGSPMLHAGAIDFHEQRYRFRVLSSSLEQGLARLGHEWHLAAEPARRTHLG